MPEHDPQKHGLRAIFTRKNKIRLISLVASLVIPLLVDLAFDAHKWAELSALRADAYVSIAQFAPWNIASRYVDIVATSGASDAGEFARRQQQWTLSSRRFACDTRKFYSFNGSPSLDQDNPCAQLPEPHGIRAFYLSAHVVQPLRFVTALFDLLLHAFVDQGLIGFLVAAAQVALGGLLTRFAIARLDIKMESFFSCVVGVPFAILALGSLAAIPLWLLALGGITVLKAFPAVALGAQAGGTTSFFSWISSKTIEEAGHEAVMKQAERIVRD